MADNELPRHLGLILDGNRRWAKQQGLPTLEGHRQGAETFRKIALAAFDRGVEYVSAYVFSNENWSRAEEEVGYLMKLAVKAVEKHLDEFHKADIKLVMLGRREGLNKDVLGAIERAEAKTANNQSGTLAFCFNYGGHEELVDAYKKLVEQGVSAGEISADKIAGALYAPEVPPLDLLVRTGGEQRLSGYMLYRSWYAELVFFDKFWPDFTVEDLEQALAEYSRRQRRFGS